MKHIKKIFGIIFFAYSSLSAQQAWAPYERQLWVRPVFVHSEYNSAYLANTRSSYDDNVRISAGSLILEYGITDRLTADISSGFGKLGRHKILDRYFGIQTTPESPDKYGVLDSRLGLRYKLIDEFDSKYFWMPTISVRAGAIKKGDYDRNPQALGDGASGGEVNLYLAKDFNLWGMGALGEWSYRKRQAPVPDDILYYGALYKRFLENIFFTIGGRGQIGQGGYAFADPRQAPPYNYYDLKIPDIITGVNLADLWVANDRPAWGRREDFHNVEVGLGYSDSYGNFYTVFYSKTLSGYNTAKLETIGFAATLPYNL
ncbi:hypothetical protein [Leptospira sp. 'Mane']|uniref:hypothetical protein n=1 Tax=Leptospira sp. 'Mane' TaxID=3387407 RepID=UPI00398A921C